MKKADILKKIEAEVLRQMPLIEPTGHDFAHVERVVKNAKYIARKEGANLFIVELAALVHEVGDWKFHGGDDTIAPKLVRRILQKHKLPESIVDHVCDIITNMSWRGGKNPPLKTLEGKIVQDADRLEAMGALGIARCFAYGATKGRPMHDPNQKAQNYTTKAAYFKSNGSSINHFYEKGLLLKDRMNTKTGKRLALPRHKFLQSYLKQFHKEWLCDL